MCIKPFPLYNVLQFFSSDFDLSKCLLSSGLPFHNILIMELSIWPATITVCSLLMRLYHSSSFSSVHIWLPGTKLYNHYEELMVKCLVHLYIICFVNQNQFVYLTFRYIYIYNVTISCLQTKITAFLLLRIIIIE